MTQRDQIIKIYNLDLNYYFDREYLNLLETLEGSFAIPNSEEREQLRYETDSTVDLIIGCIKSDLSKIKLSLESGADLDKYIGLATSLSKRYTNNNINKYLNNYKKIGNTKLWKYL